MHHEITRLKQNNRPEWHYFETDGTHIDIIIDRSVFFNMFEQVTVGYLSDAKDIAASVKSSFTMPNENSDWGFGNRFIFVDQNDDWLRYRLNLVTIAGEADRRKITTEIQYGLKLLFSLLYLFGMPSKRKTWQIGEIYNISTKDERAASYIAATFSPLATLTFVSDPVQALSGIREIMGAAHKILYPGRKFDDYSLRVHDDNGYPGFVVPGDCSCIGVTSPPAAPDINRGFELSSHNLDNVIQQLTMLVGIAKLSQNLRTMTAPK